MALSKREEVIVELAVAILRKGMSAAHDVPIDTSATRLALRCLLPHCHERWPLIAYWDSSSQDNPIGRSQGCTTAFNGIIRRLRRSGAWKN